MPPAELLVFGAVAAAVVCWAVAEVFRHRGLWAAGALLMVVHSIAAFRLFYAGSHEVARAATAQQTATLTGVQFAGGIYINYIFLTIWTADAMWWLTAPRSYAARPRLLSIAVRGFIFFIITNGAVIFADGWARVLGAASVMLVIASWFLKPWLPRDATTTAG